MNSLLFGSQSDHNSTPADFFRELDAEFHFDFDPCPLGGEERFDGLRAEWGECNFVNPPFSQTPEWIRKGVEELFKGRRSVFLVTARSNTRYWEEWVVPYASEIRFLTTCLHFGNHRRPFPLALAILVFDPQSIPRRQVVQKETHNYFSLR